MGPSRKVLRSAMVMTICLGVPSGAIPAAAQQYEASLRSLDYSPDPLARSPRLLGMGRLTLADDLHNHINLWDFAGNPTGIAEAESLTAFEYRLGTRSSTALHDLPGAPPRERQHLAARQMRHGIETWKRGPGATAYGLLGEVATLQWDRPYSGSVEERGKFTVPALAGAVNGRLPWVRSTRFDYALRVAYSSESYDDLYFDFFQLPQGEYIGKPSAVAPPPDGFTPNHAEVSNLGGGVAISMRVTSGIKAAIGYDRANAVVSSTNEALRSTSRIDERRPFDIGQVSVVGRVGEHLEFGADGRAWRSESEEFFFWSVSAGPIQEPIAGQGKRLDRKEEGTSLHTRARWVDGPFEIGAGFSTSFRRGIVTPWYPVNVGDQTGFNNFVDQVGFRAGADTLMLPARVLFSRVTERGYEIVGGGSWRLPGRRGSLGAEVHRWRRGIDQRSVGAGPKSIGWDVRAGGEYRCNAAFLARAGWSYGLSDRDDLTAENTYRHTAATTGFGYQPVGSRWSVDLGYAFEWLNPDFPDPVRSRETRQRLALQTRWPF